MNGIAGLIQIASCAAVPILYAVVAAGQQDKTSQVFLLCVLSGTHPTIGNSETDYIVKGERP